MKWAGRFPDVHAHPVGFEPVPGVFRVEHEAPCVECGEPTFWEMQDIAACCSEECWWAISWAVVGMDYGPIEQDDWDF